VCRIYRCTLHRTPTGAGGLGRNLEGSGGAPAVDPATLVAEALETCESARIFWEESDLEEALATLDLAYGLLLQIPGG